MTDVSGFGVLGHLLEMARASGASVALELESLPLLDGAVDLAREGMVSSLHAANVRLWHAPAGHGNVASHPAYPLLFDPQTAGGLLAGVTVSGVLMALFMANAGGAWDNAKKHIEGGAFGGKGSDAHKAAVVGDTVGDPFKDTAGPSLNILIKLMSVVSLVLAPVLAKWGNLFFQ